MNDIEIATKIRKAINNNDVLEVASLIKLHPAHLKRVDVFGTCLHIAAENGKLEVAKELLELGVDVNIRAGVFNGNALHSAATEGHLDMVHLLLSAGSTMDVSEPERNPLFGAILARSIDVVKSLIERGIDIQVKYTGKSMKNMDAYAFALERGEVEIAALLEKELKKTRADASSGTRN